jgi:hypothetical protein
MLHTMMRSSEPNSGSVGKVMGRVDMSISGISAARSLGLDIFLEILSRIAARFAVTP